MKVLVVYENIPESTDFYLLEVSESDWVWMRKCHGRFMNVEGSENIQSELNKLYRRLEKETKLDYYHAEPFDLGKLGLPVQLLHTGWLL